MEHEFEECDRLRNEYNDMLVYYNEPSDLLSNELQHVYDNSAPPNPLMEMGHSIICDKWLAKEIILRQKVVESINLLLQCVEDVHSCLKIWKEKQMRALIGFTFPEKDTELAAIDLE
uniref:Uncharacterized protein n=1 Tax=Plectus sambesii TaxID=2011161 RepID=A0A914XLW3_9BILA